VIKSRRGDAMTPTEVLKEIRKMPLSARRLLRDELNGDQAINEPYGYDSTEQRFVESMRRKGLITKIPNRMKGDIPKRKIERVNVTGKPISQTIIEDRG
jgi:hypothetical protein